MRWRAVNDFHLRSRVSSKVVRRGVNMRRAVRTLRPMRTAWHLALALLPLIVAAPAADAQQLIDRRQRHEYRIEPAGISLDQAVEMAQRRYRAKVVRAETVRNGDRREHHIRLLSPDGKVRNVRVDAESGAMN